MRVGVLSLDGHPRQLSTRVGSSFGRGRPARLGCAVLEVRPCAMRAVSASVPGVAVRGQGPGRPLWPEDLVALLSQ